MLERDEVFRFDEQLTHLHSPFIGAIIKYVDSEWFPMRLEGLDRAWCQSLNRTNQNQQALSKPFFVSSVFVVELAGFRKCVKVPKAIIKNLTEIHPI